MADETGIQIQGLSDLQATLDGLAEKDSNRMIRGALFDAGEPVQLAVSQRAPERSQLPSGTALPPGALKMDIVVRVPRASNILMSLIGPDTLTRHAARWVEFGHRMVRGGNSTLGRNGKYHGSGQHVGEVPEHPFMRPAWEESKALAAETFAASLRSRIEAYGKRRKRKILSE